MIIFSRERTLENARTQNLIERKTTSNRQWSMIAVIAAHVTISNIARPITLCKKQKFRLRDTIFPFHANNGVFTIANWICKNRGSNATNNSGIVIQFSNVLDYETISWFCCHSMFFSFVFLLLLHFASIAFIVVGNVDQKAIGRLIFGWASGIAPICQLDVRAAAVFLLIFVWLWGRRSPSPTKQ